MFPTIQKPDISIFSLLGRWVGLQMVNWVQRGYRQSNGGNSVICRINQQNPLAESMISAKSFCQLPNFESLKLAKSRNFRSLSVEKWIVPRWSKVAVMDKRTVLDRNLAGQRLICGMLQM